MLVRLVVAECGAMALIGRLNSSALVARAIDAVMDRIRGIKELIILSARSHEAVLFVKPYYIRAGSLNESILPFIQSPSTIHFQSASCTYARCMPEATSYTARPRPCRLHSLSSLFNSLAQQQFQHNGFPRAKDRRGMESRPLAW